MKKYIGIDVSKRDFHVCLTYPQAKLRQEEVCLRESYLENDISEVNKELTEFFDDNSSIYYFTLIFVIFL